MYGVINNSMGSGSVTYECEGHETRLSYCSTLSSTIAPCYYALVKCFSTTDKGSGVSTTSPTTSGSSGSGEITGSTTSGSSTGIVAGVVVSLLAVLLVVTIVIIIFIVWLGLKTITKNLKPGDNNASTTSPQTSPPAVMTDTEKAYNITLLHDNPSYQPTTAVLSGTEASNVTQLQENPSYQPITVDSAGTDASNMMLFQENPSYISTHFPDGTN